MNTRTATPSPSPARRLPTSTPLRAVVSALLICAITSPATAAELRGVVLDVFTGAPAADVRVSVVDGSASTLTDDQGRYSLEVEGTTDLLVERDGYAMTWLRQEPSRDSVLRVFSDADPGAGVSWGAPIQHRPVSERVMPDRPVSLTDFLPGGELYLTFPGVLPETIRVGRRFADTCSGHPIQRIDEVPIEEYVHGVLLPEIGVFRAVEGGPDSAAEVFKAFAVAARSYAVWWYLSEPEAEFHIDDTACNQRYEDARDEWVSAQVTATTGQIMVQTTDETVLEKLEYAASCGRHGTLPEFQESTVPDDTGVEACVRDWCGHNGCAGHQVNPEFPDEGRCLVRGVCQWGSVERSMAGQSYTEILAHYQPNTTLRSFTTGPSTPPIGGGDVGTDAGGTDAGGTDAGATDAGATDAGATDAGRADTGANPGQDSGATDAPATPDVDPGDDFGTGGTDSGAGGATDGAQLGAPVPLLSLANDDTAIERGCTATPTRSAPLSGLTLLALIALSRWRFRAHDVGSAEGH